MFFAFILTRYQANEFWTPNFFNIISILFLSPVVVKSMGPDWAKFRHFCKINLPPFEGLFIFGRNTFFGKNYAIGRCWEWPNIENIVKAIGELPQLSGFAMAVPGSNPKYTI